MSRYFSGTAIGTVAALSHPTFEALCEELIEYPIALSLKRDEYRALPKPEQDKAKRVQYLTAATFKDSPSPRRYENAAVCNLIFLDVDDPKDAARVMEHGAEMLGHLGHTIAHTASSLPDRPRLRVMVNAESIPVALYGQAVETIAGLLGIQSNRESRVAVQPMYLPVLFEGQVDSPIVSRNYKGDAFMLSDIEDAVGSAAPEHPTADTPQTVGDLDFLRAPMADITTADAQNALAAIDPNIAMQKWVEVGMGLKHQFGDAGFALWDEWSEGSEEKYDGTDELEKRWASFKQNPNRHPVTIRTVFKYAMDAGWKNEVVVKKVTEELNNWIKNAQRSTEQLIDEGPVRIAKVTDLITSLQKKTIIGTLRSTITARGIDLSSADIRKAVSQAEVDASRSAGLQPWTRGLCYCTGPNFFYQRLTDQRFKPEVLDLMHSAEPEGEERMLSPKHYAIQVAQVKQVENLRYDPRHPDKAYFTEDGQVFCNTYRPSYVPANHDPKKIAEAAEVLHRHLGNLIAEPQYRRVVLDFIAFLVQHPGKKIRWSPLIQSGEGAGKTWFADLCKAILGARNVSKLSGALVIDDKQNGWAYGRQLVAIEEIRVVGRNRHAVMDKLKPLITDDDFSLREFGEGPRTVPNLTNYIMFTNYQDSLAVTEDSRRYFVLVSPIQNREDVEKIGGEKYFNQLYGALQKNAGGFRAFFETYKISPSFNPNSRAPETPYLKELAENASSPLTAAIRQCISDQPHALLRDDLLSIQVLEGYVGQMRGVGEFGIHALASVLREIGWRKASRTTLAGERHALWTHGSGIKNPVATAIIRMELL